MQISLALTLPREGVTVPVARRIVISSMAEAGVDPECLDDVAVAMSEACTNVVKHSGPGDEYQVRCTVDGDRCVIEVTDVGHGFDVESLSESNDSAEHGRGVELMRVLVDRLKFTSRPQQGTVVHLEKTLTYRDPSLLKQAAAEGSG